MKISLSNCSMCSFFGCSLPYVTVATFRLTYEYEIEYGYDF